jgi:hypothetical protein
MARQRRPSTIVGGRETSRRRWGGRASWVSCCRWVESHPPALTPDQSPPWYPRSHGHSRGPGDSPGTAVTTWDQSFPSFARLGQLGDWWMSRFLSFSASFAAGWWDGRSSTEKQARRKEWEREGWRGGR